MFETHWREKSLILRYWISRIYFSLQQYHFIFTSRKFNLDRTNRRSSRLNWSMTIFKVCGCLILSRRLFLTPLKSKSSKLIWILLYINFISSFTPSDNTYFRCLEIFCLLSEVTSSFSPINFEDLVSCLFPFLSVAQAGVSHSEAVLLFFYIITITFYIQNTYEFSSHL
jgi:hypothetical protein